MQKKDHVISFLKSQGWTQEDMNQNWFINKDGDHSYGQKTEDNLLKTGTHSVIIEYDNVWICTSNHYGSFDETLPRILVTGKECIVCGSFI